MKLDLRSLCDSKEEGTSMIVGKEFVPSPYQTAAEHMARHLADWIRAVWLQNTAQGLARFEDGFYEEPMSIEYVRSENFPKLHGIDYIFHWWGSRGEETSDTAGALTVLWKVESDDPDEQMKLYRTYIYFTDYDLELGLLPNETERREDFENRIIQVFADWEKTYKETVIK